MEREVATHRRNLRGRVAQVDVTADRDLRSLRLRAGDPHLHTHVVISNKAKTASDGKWRSLTQADARRRCRAL